MATIPKTHLPNYKDDLISFAKLFSHRFHANNDELKNLSDIKSNQYHEIINYWQQFLDFHSCCADIVSITTAEEIEKLIVKHFEQKFHKTAQIKMK